MSPHGITGPRTTKVHEIRGISVYLLDPNVAKFRRAPTKSVRDIPWKNFAHGKSRPKFKGHQICHQSIGRTRVSTDNY